jgi:hypothetical protein
MIMGIMRNQMNLRNLRRVRITSMIPMRIPSRMRNTPLKMIPQTMRTV